MPPTPRDISNLVQVYLAIHPAEHEGLQPLLASLDAAQGDSAGSATLPGHITCGAVVIDRNRRVLHVRRQSDGLAQIPGGLVEAGDRTLLETALRNVREAAGLEPGDLCLTPHLRSTPLDIDVHAVDLGLTADEPASRHVDVRWDQALAHPRAGGTATLHRQGSHLWNSRGPNGPSTSPTAADSDGWQTGRSS
ncbi:NUDIX domain-containing protein [Streptomyces sp. NPDC001070]